METFEYYAMENGMLHSKIYVDCITVIVQLKKFNIREYDMTQSDKFQVF